MTSEVRITFKLDKTTDEFSNYGITDKDERLTKVLGVGKL